MGPQRLLLALTVLLVTKFFTFLSPLSPELRIGDFSDFAQDRSVQPSNPVPENPIADLPPQAFSSQPSPQPEAQSPSLEQAPFDSANEVYPNERNPVQEWENFEPDSIAPPQETVPNSGSPTPCQSVRKAVVTIRAGREVGSGSIVSHDGLVITNFHVVRRLRDRPVFVQMNGGDRLLGRVVAYDRQNDLALIQLETTGTLPVIRLALTEASTAVGQSVCAIGSPFGQEGKITQGTLTQILANGDLQSNVELQPGNSGGPLINAQGEMIGINKGVARNREVGERVSYATNAIVAKQFIDQNHTIQP